MRICHVISGIDIDNGGPPVALGGLAAAQVRAGLEVSVLSSYRFAEKSFPVAEDWRKKGIRVRLVGPAREPMSRHPRLRSAADEMAAAHDILHVHSMWESIQYHGSRAALAAGRPLVMTPHGMLDTWNMRQSALRKRIYLALRMRHALDRAAAIHAATPIEKQHLERFNFRAPIFVEPHGLDLAEFRALPPRGQFRRRFTEIADHRFVLFLGRIDRNKGLELLVPAMAQVDPAIHLVIAGPDWNNTRAIVEQEIARLALRERVHFTGMLKGSERIEALVDAELLALPSFHENFGIVVAEALASGTPAIVSDQVYLHPEVSSAGVGGVVPLDTEALARELNRWLADDALRAAATERARPFALERYDWDAIARRWIGHYERCLSAPSAQGA